MVSISISSRAEGPAVTEEEAAELAARALLGSAGDTGVRSLAEAATDIVVFKGASRGGLVDGGEGEGGEGEGEGEEEEEGARDERLAGMMGLSYGNGQ